MASKYALHPVIPPFFIREHTADLAHTPQQPDGENGGPTLPTLESALDLTQHEVLQNFFKSLLNLKDRVLGPGSSAVGPGAATGKPPATWGGCAGAGGASASGGIRRRIRMQEVGRRMRSRMRV